MQQLEIGEEKTIAREEGSQVKIVMMVTTLMVTTMMVTTMRVKVMTRMVKMVMNWEEKAIARKDSTHITNGNYEDD